jgi:hypothetical protein
MFKQRTNIRARPPAVPQRRRQGRPLWLSVEPMEPRLMLSAMSLSFTPVNQETPQISAEVGRLNPGGGQIFRIATPGEGGFIGFDSSPTSASLDGTLVLSGGVVANSVPRVSGSISLADNVGIDGATWTYVLPTASFEVRPAVIVTSESGAVLRPSFEPVKVGDWAYRNDREPGGSIPIESILKGIEQGNALESSHQLRTTLAADAAVDTASPLSRGFSSRLSLSANSDPEESSRESGSVSVETTISGEWARAMVFETAGGEPLEFSPTQVKQGKSSPPPDPESDRTGEGPLSSHAIQHASQGITQLASAGRTDTAAEIASAAGEAIDSRTLNRVANERLGPFASNRNLPDHQPDLVSSESAEDTAVGQGGLDGFQVLVSAAEAFAQFGTSETALIRASADDDTPRGSLIAPSVLTLLALEWIAVSHSRRANKDISTHMAWPPRRSSKSADDSAAR